MPKPSAKNVLGFTLVELLVVITIIGILSAIAITIYSGVTASAKDAKRKADLLAIYKAYEVHKDINGNYLPLQDDWFAGGSIPKTPEGGDYPCIIGPGCTLISGVSNDPTQVVYGVTLGGTTQVCSPPSSACYAISSSGVFPDVSPAPVPPASPSVSPSSSPTPSPASSPSPSPSPSPLACNITNGLEGYWKLDGNTVDSTGNGWDGTSGGGLTCTTAGKLGQACSFDGVDDYIKIPTVVNTITNPMENPTNFTVTAWIKLPTSLTASIYYDILGHQGTDPTAGYQIQILPTSATASPPSTARLAFMMRDDATPTSNSAFAAWNSLYLDNSSQWYFVAVSVTKSATAVGYGARSDSATLTTLGSVNISAVTGNLSNTANEIRIGARASGAVGGRFFKGVIDDVRFYNRALSAGEVATLYNSGAGCAP